MDQFLNSFVHSVKWCVAFVRISLHNICVYDLIIKWYSKLWLGTACFQTSYQNTLNSTHRNWTLLLQILSFPPVWASVETDLETRNRAMLITKTWESHRHQCHFIVPLVNDLKALFFCEASALFVTYFVLHIVDVHV